MTRIRSLDLDQRRQAAADRRCRILQGGRRQAQEQQQGVDVGRRQPGRGTRGRASQEEGQGGRCAPSLLPVHLDAPDPLDLSPTAAAARDDSNPLKPTSGSKATDTGNKKLKLKRKRSSAPKIPVIRDDSSDDDLPVIVGKTPRSSDSGPSAVDKKEREVIVVDTETESDDVRQVPAKKKKQAALREVSPEL